MFFYIYRRKQLATATIVHTPNLPSSAPLLTVSFFVNKEAHSMVRPSGPAPSGHRLPLSALERLPFMRNLVELIMVFDHGKEAAEAVRTALGRALVPYYPVAGRIAAADTDTDTDTEGSTGEVGVACTGEGVWFVKASSDSRLQDVLEPLMIPKEELLPSPPPQGVDHLALPFMMQVTEFNIWCRDLLQCPLPAVPTDQLDDDDDDDEHGMELVFSVIDTPMSCIERQKERYAEETGQKCTTFDVVAAKLWRSRARAIGLHPAGAAVVSFSSLACIRHLHEELAGAGGGYYGNCFHPISIEAPGGRIAEAPLSDVVALVREAKERVPTEYSDSLKGVGGPPLAGNAYGNLAMVDWRRIGFYEADFGWGGPSRVLSLTGYRGTAGAACVLNSPAPKKGISVMIHSVAKEHYEAFLTEMNDWS